MNKKRTPEEKEAQRLAARKAKQAERREMLELWRLEHHWHNPALAVACAEVGIRYKPIPHARTREDAEQAHLYIGLDDLNSKLALHRLAPDSFEFITERVRG